MLYCTPILIQSVLMNDDGLQTRELVTTTSTLFLLMFTVYSAHTSIMIYYGFPDYTQAAVVALKVFFNGLYECVEDCIFGCKNETVKQMGC